MRAMSGRLSFFSDYMPVRDGLDTIAHTVVQACERRAATGETLAFAQEVKAKLETLHEQLLQVTVGFPVNLSVDQLRVRFTQRLERCFEPLGLPAECSVPPVDLKEFNGHPVIQKALTDFRAEIRE